MREATVRLANRLGLHARAAAQVVRTAREFESEITVSSVDNDKAASARSILDLLALSASRGVDLIITASGADESEAVAAIERLFADRFGED